MKNFIIQKAIEEANLSNINIKHGAVLFSGGKILTTACNNDRSCYGGKACTMNTHAEVAAILKYRFLRARQDQQ